MPFDMRGCALICTIFYISVLVVCLLVSAALSSTSSPEEYQGSVEHINTTTKPRTFPRRPSELDAVSLSAPLFRNVTLGVARFETDSSFKLDARAGGCQCSGLSNECCTPTASSEAPFCMTTGSICCTNTYCVETESCCGNGGCCPANTSCYMKSNGPGCCPNGHFCSEHAICYDYTSSNCSDNNTPSAQCCPPDLPFCNFLEQVGYGCYATSTTAASSTSSTNPSTTIPKFDLTDLTTTSSSTQTSSNTITVAVTSNSKGGLNVNHPSSVPRPHSIEEGEATKNILSNGIGTTTPTLSNPTISSKPPTSPTPIISGSSSPPISTPPNSITTSGTAEFPLATTISTSPSSPLLAPFRFVTDHPYIFIFLYTLWILGLVQESTHNLLNIIMASWTIGNFMYFIFFHAVLVATPPAPAMPAEDGEKGAGSKENETRKKQSLQFMWLFFYRKVSVTTPPPAGTLAEEEEEKEEEEEAGSEENEARRDEVRMMKNWRLERLERRLEVRKRSLEMRKCISERLDRRLDRKERELERAHFRESMEQEKVQWRRSMERMAAAIYKN